MHALTASELFRATWPRHTAKQAARAAMGPVSTAKAWVQARFCPSFDAVMAMAAENTELRAELVRRLGEWDQDAKRAPHVAVPIAAAESGVAVPAWVSSPAAGAGAGERSSAQPVRLKTKRA